MPHPEERAVGDPSAGSEQVTLSWIREILQALASPDLTARSNALTHLLPALVEKDASSAGVLAEANTAPGTRADLMQRVAQLWAAQDPTGALTWAAGLSDPQERHTTLSDVCRQIARDPSRATAWVQQLPPGSSLRALAEQELAKIDKPQVGKN